ncbi:putative kinesin light chain 1 [Diaporthe ampelina]|uniref:Putative kinesin light chain 1 n=1 Tax=Diaporthe ampelina TaxID=1214573 RepID=A0A0G2HRY8_9PEZI|nr:putative kinesin light chain 1 [Diaporthe ampelina]
MLPFPVAKGFARRDGILEKIKAKFDYSSKIALVGPCGSGKTHVAVEYADGFLKENPDAKILWVNASNTAEFELSFDAIKDKMKLKQRRKGDFMEVVRDFLKQGESGQWLMIIDGLDQAGASYNAAQSKDNEPAKDHDSLESIIDYIPEGHMYGGQVLVTTRSKSMATRVVNHKYIVELPAKLSEEDVALLLGVKNGISSSSTSYQTKIAGALQRSAGALALVRAYKETSGAEFFWKDLWKLVEASNNETSDLKNASPTWEQIKAMNGIWKPLYSQLETNHAEAARLLQILSLLEVQSIPIFLIEKYFDDKSHRAKQVKVLTDYDMLELSVNRRDARVTPLVRLSTNAMLDSNRSDDASFLKQAALALVVDAFPSADSVDNIKCKALKPCAMAALRLGSDSAEGRHKRAQLLLNVAAYEKRLGRYDPAAELLEQCLDLCKSKTKTPDATRKRIQKEAKKLLDETQKEQQRSQRRRSREKGGSPPPDDSEKFPDMRALVISPESKADDVHKVSRGVLAAHRQPDLMEDNIKHSQQILDWCRARYGPRHQDTVRQLYNVALAHDAHGDHASAEQLYLEAIGVMEGIYGKGSTSAELLRMQASLARMYCQQARFADADALLKRVVRGQAESLGPDHPETLVTRMNLALVAQELRPDELEAPARALQGVLAAQVRLLGDEHPATLNTACNLAQNYQASGRVAEAEPLLRLSLGEQRKSLGERHPDTVRTMEMLKELEG